MNFPTNFIKASEDFNTLERTVPAPYFRRSFEVKNGLKTATLVITGLGFYKVSINGENITKGFLAPYRSNIDDIVYYDRYDLTNRLKAGKNTLGVLLGNGLRNSVGGFVWEFHKAKFRGAPITTFSVELEYEDDTLQTVLSDCETRVFPSPILFDDLHFGEYYDARLEIPGWNLPDFDDSCWKPALSAEQPRGEARICEAEPIVIKDTVEPISVTEYEGGYVYDFGVNNAGLCRLTIKGTAGQKIVLRHFETYKDGKPYFRNFRFHDEDRFQEDEYICSGKGTESYVPSFTYHGFRYVLVNGITKEQATKELLTYLVIYSDIQSAGSFCCSNEIVNKIQEITRRSDTSNFFYFPTDCPQREKNGWTADAALSCEQMLLNFHPENSYKEWLRNIYKTVNDKGQLPGIVPTGGWGYEWGNGPAWDSVMIYLPYFTYLYRGNIGIFDELAAPLMRYLHYLFTSLDENGCIAVGLGDWCQVGKPYEYDYTAPQIVTDTVITYDIAEKSAFIFEVLKMELQKQFAKALAQKIRNGFRANLIDPKTLIVEGNSQTGQAMALYYGMFEENEKGQAFEVLLKMIASADDHFDVGVLGARVLFRLLADNGKADLAYKMIARTDYPSYGNLVVKGATTLPEGFWQEKTESLNHHFWGDVSAWFYIYLAGIRVNPTGRDANNIDVKPCFIDSLSSVSACYDTVSGKIEVDIARDSEKITVTIKAVDALHGIISLPDGYVFEGGGTEKPLKTGAYSVRQQTNTS